MPDPNDLSRAWYHGTRAWFDHFGLGFGYRDEDELNAALGVHLADGEQVARQFAAGLYRAGEDVLPVDGWILDVELSRDIASSSLRRFDSEVAIDAHVFDRLMDAGVIRWPRPDADPFDLDEVGAALEAMADAFGICEKSLARATPGSDGARARVAELAKRKHGFFAGLSHEALADLAEKGRALLLADGVRVLLYTNAVEGGDAAIVLDPDDVTIVARRRLADPGQAPGTPQEAVWHRGARLESVSGTAGPMFVARHRPGVADLTSDGGPVRFDHCLCWDEPPAVRPPEYVEFASVDLGDPTQAVGDPAQLCGVCRGYFPTDLAPAVGAVRLAPVEERVPDVEELPWEPLDWGSWPDAPDGPVWDPAEVAMQVRESVVESMRDLETSRYDLNNGACEDLAWDLVAVIPGARVMATPDWSAGEVNHDTRCCDTHVWIEVGGLHYDAEACEGVSDWRALPLFRRNAALRRAGPTRGARFARALEGSVDSRPVPSRPPGQR